MRIFNFAVVTTISFFLSGTPKVTGKEVSHCPSSRFAEIVETLLSEMTASRYQHNTEIDEEAGIWNCDCSGFMGHILRRHFPEAYLHVEGETRPERVRPLSANFCETFITAGQNEDPNWPWKQIAIVKDLRAGDILAWKKTKIVKGSTTGHVLMIASTPQREEGGLYRIRVIDSTRGLHAEDTRTKDSLGVGAGVMWLSADQDGKLNGFKNSDLRSLSTKNILAAGRMVTVSGRTRPFNKKDQAYLGLKTDAAHRLAKTQGMKSRVIAENRKSFSVTRKIEKTRVNFVLKDGQVIRVVRG